MYSIRMGDEIWKTRLYHTKLILKLVEFSFVFAENILELEKANRYLLFIKELWCRQVSELELFHG
jgi:hypothetical protein